MLTTINGTNAMALPAPVWRLLAGAIGDPLGASAAGDLFDGRHELVADDAHLTTDSGTRKPSRLFFHRGNHRWGFYTQKNNQSIREIIGVR